MRYPRLTLLSVTTALILLLLAAGAPAQSSSIREYQVKAAFIYNFSKYVEWPAESFANSASPIVVTVLGSSANAGAFETIRGKTVRSRRIDVRTARRVEDLGATHILFVCASEKEHLGRVLDYARNQSVLTISDMEHFDQYGGVITFVTVDDKVRFHINLAAARKSGLRISSQLLKLARNVIE